MVHTEMMNYLTLPLREVAQYHLHADETVLTAIYAHPTVFPARFSWLWLTWYRQVYRPARAFVLTAQRALILEDPTDHATSSAGRDYLFSSCSLDRIMLFEARSHLLDCALTLVLATSSGPERVTIEYSGVSEQAFLGAIACMRALIDGLPLPASTRPDETNARERTAARKEWHAALMGLELHQENAVMRYLVSGERVQEWLSVPAVDESTWWQRLGVGAHEQPASIVVRTDRQVLLVKETRRIVRGQVTYGNDAWLMPKARLQAASIISDEGVAEMQLTLEHIGTSEVVRLPVPSELAERARALVTSSRHVDRK